MYEKVERTLEALGFSDAYMQLFIDNEVDDLVVQYCLAQPTLIVFTFAEILRPVGRISKFLAKFSELISAAATNVTSEIWMPGQISVRSGNCIKQDVRKINPYNRDMKRTPEPATTPTNGSIEHSDLVQPPAIPKAVPKVTFQESYEGTKVNQSYTKTTSELARPLNTGTIRLLAPHESSSVNHSYTKTTGESTSTSTVPTIELSYLAQVPQPSQRVQLINCPELHQDIIANESITKTTAESTSTFTVGTIEIPDFDSAPEGSQPVQLIACQESHQDSIANESITKTTAESTSTFTVGTIEIPDFDSAPEGSQPVQLIACQESHQDIIANESITKTTAESTSTFPVGSIELPDFDSAPEGSQSVQLIACQESHQDSIANESITKTTAESTSTFTVGSIELPDFDPDPEGSQPVQLIACQELHQDSIANESNTKTTSESRSTSIVGTVGLLDLDQCPEIPPLDPVMMSQESHEDTIMYEGNTKSNGESKSTFTIGTPELPDLGHKRECSQPVTIMTFKYTNVSSSENKSTAKTTSESTSTVTIGTVGVSDLNQGPKIPPDLVMISQESHEDSNSYESNKRTITKTSGESTTTSTNGTFTLSDLAQSPEPSLSVQLTTRQDSHVESVVNESNTKTTSESTTPFTVETIEILDFDSAPEGSQTVQLIACQGSHQDSIANESNTKTTSESSSTFTVATVCHSDAVHCLEIPPLGLMMTSQETHEDSITYEYNNKTTAESTSTFTVGSIELSGLAEVPEPSQSIQLIAGQDSHKDLLANESNTKTISESTSIFTVGTIELSNLAEAPQPSKPVQLIECQESHQDIIANESNTKTTAESTSTFTVGTIEIPDFDPAPEGSQPVQLIACQESHQDSIANESITKTTAESTSTFTVGSIELPDFDSAPEGSQPVQLIACQKSHQDIIANESITKTTAESTSTFTVGTIEIPDFDSAPEGSYPVQLIACQELHQDSIANESNTKTTSESRSTSIVGTVGLLDLDQCPEIPPLDPVMMSQESHEDTIMYEGNTKSNGESKSTFTIGTPELPDLGHKRECSQPVTIMTFKYTNVSSSENKSTAKTTSESTSTVTIGTVGVSDLNQGPKIPPDLVMISQESHEDSNSYESNKRTITKTSGESTTTSTNGTFTLSDLAQSPEPSLSVQLTTRQDSHVESVVNESNTKTTSESTTPFTVETIEILDFDSAPEGSQTVQLIACQGSHQDSIANESNTKTTSESSSTFTVATVCHSDAVHCLEIPPLGLMMTSQETHEDSITYEYNNKTTAESTSTFTVGSIELSGLAEVPEPSQSIQLIAGQDSHKDLLANESNTKTISESTSIFTVGTIELSNLAEAPQPSKPVQLIKCQESHQDIIANESNTKTTAESTSTFTVGTIEIPDFDPATEGSQPVQLIACQESHQDIIANESNTKTTAESTSTFTVGSIELPDFDSAPEGSQPVQLIACQESHQDIIVNESITKTTAESTSTFTVGSIELPDFDRAPEGSQPVQLIACQESHQDSIANESNTKTTSESRSTSIVGTVGLLDLDQCPEIPPLDPVMMSQESHEDTIMYEGNTKSNGESKSTFTIGTPELLDLGHKRECSQLVTIMTFKDTNVSSSENKSTAKTTSESTSFVTMGTVGVSDLNQGRKIPPLDLVMICQESHEDSNSYESNKGTISNLAEAPQPSKPIQLVACQESQDSIVIESHKRTTSESTSTVTIGNVMLSDLVQCPEIPQRDLVMTNEESHKDSIPDESKTKKISELASTFTVGTIELLDLVATPPSTQPVQLIGSPDSHKDSSANVTSTKTTVESASPFIVETIEFSESAQVLKSSQLLQLITSQECHEGSILKGRNTKTISEPMVLPGRGNVINMYAMVERTLEALGFRDTFMQFFIDNGVDDLAVQYCLAQPTLIVFTFAEILRPVGRISKFLAKFSELISAAATNGISEISTTGQISMRRDSCVAEGMNELTQPVQQMAFQESLDSGNLNESTIKTTSELESTLTNGTIELSDLPQPPEPSQPVQLTTSQDSHEDSIANEINTKTTSESASTHTNGTIGLLDLAHAPEPSPLVNVVGCRKPHGSSSLNESNTKTTSESANTRTVGTIGLADPARVPESWQLVTVETLGRFDLEGAHELSQPVKKMTFREPHDSGNLNEINIKTTSESESTLTNGTMELSDLAQPPELPQPVQDQTSHTNRWPEQMGVLLQSLPRPAKESFGGFYFYIQHLELDLTFTSAENPWESFFTCILQQIFHQHGCNDLETIVQQAGESWPRLQIKMNKIDRCSSEAFGKRITCEDISKTIKCKSSELQEWLYDFLDFLLVHFDICVKLSFFDWENSTIHPFNYSDGKYHNIEHVMIVHDPEINCFRLVIPRFEPDSDLSIDEYFEALFNQMIDTQEMLPYLKSRFEQLKTPEFHHWAESEFMKLEKVKSILDFPEIMLPKYEEIVPLSNFTLLARHYGSIQPSTGEEILSEIKRQYIHTVECASRSVLTRRIAEQKDNVLRSSEEEEKLVREEHQLKIKMKEIEDKKALQELEIKKFRQMLATDERARKQQEELIRLQEQDIAKSDEELKENRIRLAWNTFRKELMETQLSYETLQIVSQVDLTASGTLQQMCKAILDRLASPFFKNDPIERQNLISYASKNDNPVNRSKVSDIISFLFQPPKVSPNMDNKDILEVTGRHLIVSEVLKKISKYSFKELRLVAGLTIFLDADLYQGRFHGISVAMCAPTVEVIGNVTINTSGNPGDPEKKPPKAPNGKNPGLNGTDGEDGTAGESAGHVYIQASLWTMPENLTIIANGGDGGHGQDGGDGADGDEGTNGVEGNAEETRSKWSVNSTKYIDRGTQGRRGGKGGNGGREGLGGGGGKKGIIDVSPQDVCVKAIGNDGCQGEDGKSGAGGKGGAGGSDGTDHGIAQHNYAFAGYEWRDARGSLAVRKQDVWYGGQGWELIKLKTEQQVRSCRASSGENGTREIKASNQANKRNTASSRKQIPHSEMLSLSRNVRQMYTHKDLSNLTKETPSLQADQRLEESRRNQNNNLRASAKEGMNEIRASVNESKQKVYLAEQSKVNLESQWAGEMRQKHGIQQKLQKIVSEKEHYNSIIDGATSEKNVLTELFQKKLKIQNQVQQEQEIRTTVMKEFDGSSLKPVAKKEVIISEDMRATKKELMEQYQSVPDLATLPDEVLPIMLASKLRNQELADAFETGVQSVVSTHPLTPATKGFILKVFDSYLTPNAPSSVIYPSSHLSADTAMVERTQTWAEQNPDEVGGIFDVYPKFTRTGVSGSIGDFLLNLRTSADLKFPKNIQSCYSQLITLLSKSENSSTAKKFLRYVSSVMVDRMDAWLLEKCKGHHSTSKPEIYSYIVGMLKTVRSIFFEVSAIFPSVSLRDSYSNFLAIITTPSTKTDRAIWQEFVLLALKIKSKSRQTTSAGQDSDFELIEAKLVAQEGSLSKLSSKGPTVLAELCALTFAMRYVNLSQEELQKLASKCERLSCFVLKTYQDVFEELQNFQKSIEENFRKYHLEPARLEIKEHISRNLQGNFRELASKGLENVSGFFGSMEFNAMSFRCRLNCLQDYGNFLKQSPRDVKVFLRKLKRFLLKKIRFQKEPRRNDTPGSTCSVPPSLITATCIPYIAELLKLIRRTTSLGYIIGSIPTKELSVVSQALRKFFEMNPNFNSICLIQRELERFQVCIKDNSVRSVRNKIKAVVKDRKKTMVDLDKKIEDIVQLVRQLIENSNQILHMQEILMSIKMHLIKIVDGLQFCCRRSSDIHFVLDKFFTEFTKLSKEVDAKSLIDGIQTMINDETLSLTETLCLSLRYEYTSIPDVISRAAKKLEELKETPPDENTVVFLKTTCDIISHSKHIYLNVFDDDPDPPDPPKLNEAFHTLIQTVANQKYLHEDSRIPELVRQLDTLVTAHEASNFSCCFQAILDSRRTRSKDLEEKVEFLIQRSQKDLEHVLEVSLQSQVNSFICKAPFKHYRKFVSKFIWEEFERSDLQTCKMTMAQIYVKSFHKFPCLQDPKLPAVVRNQSSGQGCSTGWKQFLSTILKSLADDSQNIAFITDVMLIVQKMAGTVSQGDISCEEIYSLVGEINQFSSTFEDPKLQGVLESMVEGFTTLSLQIVFSCAKEGATKDLERRNFLEKVDNCISLVMLRRGSLQRNVFRCKVFHILDGYFLDFTSTKPVATFYKETIVPLIHEEFDSIFPPEVSPNNCIRKHFNDIIKGDVENQESLVSDEVEHPSSANCEPFKKWVDQNCYEILGFTVLHCDLTELEQEFPGVVAKHSKSWQLTDGQREDLLDMIYHNDPPNPDKNRLIEICLPELDSNEGTTLTIPFLSTDQQMYLTTLIQTVTPSAHSQLKEVVDGIYINIFVPSSPAEWGTSLKDLAKDALFTRFLNLNVGDNFLDQAGVGKTTKLREKIVAFRKSHKENASNEEEIKLSSRHYDLQIENDIQLEETVTEMIRFKHFFNRHFHFKSAEPDTEIFQWLDLFYQRCKVCRVQLTELNDLFYRFTELPSKELSQTVSKAKLFEWTEAILIQIAANNYRSLWKKAASSRSDHIDDFNMVKCLENWKDRGSAKNKLIEILSDAILQEIIYSGGSAAVNLEVIRRAAESILNVKISVEFVNAINQSPLATWPTKARRYQLLEKFDESTSDAILKFEDKFGSWSEKLLKICEVKMCKGQPPKLIWEFINNFNSCRWDLDDTLWTEIEKCHDFKELWGKCQAYADKVNSRERGVKEIARLMRGNQRNSNFRFYLDFRPVSNKPNAQLEEKCPLEKDVEAIWGKLKVGSVIVSGIEKESKASVLNETPSAITSFARAAKIKLQTLLGGPSMAEFDSPIETWSADRIQRWAALILCGAKNDRTRVVKENLHEVLAIISRAVCLKEKYYPRDTQLVSAWLLIQRSFREKGCLAEIQTGEGKTLIVAIMVIVRVLCGDNVDVITSSPVLAEENLSQVRYYYGLFNADAATNCDAEAEKSEKVRKERYCNRIIYGDVGSFQRDVLLTDYFGKGITNGRTSDIVFIDEVDSMLLDKGENILYLSHNLPDLRSLWPIFVEIWNVVHAPDVCRGLAEHVVKVQQFIKKRMNEGDIFFPNSLENFINEKLVVWIQNAFLAMNMKENDPYILSDVNKKGPTIVIMDKDTGVEQVTMNWSNGLHQFIQLKHTDRLTSESLKAVFMSNICYFRKFTGKLFGITGTLGSTTERELLSQCYEVDYFAVPRFQPRRCTEEDGVVLQTESAWVSTIQEVVQAKCEKEQAVLIICENVESVDKIVKRLRPLYPNKVSAYKSSFDDGFRKKKETSPLNCKDVVVATNIAGRGTDLLTSEALEEAGGLHVILSYMPGNVRIEEQAFGRTARKGLRGSVQYIVLHDGTAETTVDSLRRERDENESTRLDNFRVKSIPRIEIEEKLCQMFLKTLQNVKSKMGEKDPDVEGLHLENLKNKWALWLDSMSERLKSVHVTKEEPILEAFKKFEEEMLSKAASASKFESGPVEFVKLGKLHEDKGNISMAKSYYDTAIKSEPNYSDVAHFYKAACILKENASDMNAKRQAIFHLKASHKLLKKRINQLLVSSQTLQMTDSLRRSGGKGTISNRYEKQVENECELYQVHCGKIEEAIGASITPGTFKNVKFILDEQECSDIFNTLRKNDDVFKNYRLSKKISFDKKGDIIVDKVTNVWPATLIYCKTPIVEFLNKSVIEGTRSDMEDNAFCKVLENSKVMRSNFCEFLIENKVLINVYSKDLLIIRSSDKDKWKHLVLPGELKNFQGFLETTLERCDNDIYDMDLLNSLDRPQEELSAIEVALSLAGIISLESVKFAEVNPEFTAKLKWNTMQKSFDGFPPELEEYKDLIGTTIQAFSVDASEQFIFEKQVKFEDVPLPDDAVVASQQIWSFLRGIGAIKDVSVRFPLDLAQDKSRVEKRLHEIRTSLGMGLAANGQPLLMSILCKYHHEEEIRPSIDDVMAVLQGSIGKIKTLPGIEVSYSSLSDYYKTGSYPPELEDFDDQSFGEVLELTEKKDWWDWGAFTVASLGLLQIVAGIILTVVSTGVAANLGIGLIGEGVGDVLFAIQAGPLNRNFSWSDYRTHKVISVAISLLTGGIGPLISTSGQVAGLGVKGAFSLLKIVGKDLIKRAGMAILDYTADWGFDQAMNFIRELTIANCKTKLSSTIEENNKKLFNELRVVMDEVHTESSDNSQAMRILDETFKGAFDGEKKGVVGYNIALKSAEMTQTVASCLGNCSKLADHEAFANSTNKWVGIVKKTGKIMSYIKNTLAFLTPILEMAVCATAILTKFITLLRARLEGLRRSRIERQGSISAKSTQSCEEFAKFKGKFEKDISTEIISYIAMTVQEEFLRPAFKHTARSAVKYFSKRMKRNAKKSHRLLNTEKMTKTIRDFPFKIEGTEDQASFTVKGKVNIKDLDPDTLLQDAGLTLSSAMNLFGDNATFYQDSKGKVYFGKPSLENCIKNFGKGKTVSVLELFVCACYFGFIINVEDNTGELNFKDNKIQISPISHGGSLKGAKCGFTEVSLVYYRDEKGKARFNPIDSKKKAQMLLDGGEIRGIGLYQSLLFLKATDEVREHRLKKTRDSMMKEACDAFVVAKEIIKVQKFVRTNLKDFNIAEHLYAKLAQHSSATTGTKITMESVQTLSLDGVEHGNDGYGYGYILRKMDDEPRDHSLSVSNAVQL